MSAPKSLLAALALKPKTAPQNSNGVQNLPTPEAVSFELFLVDYQASLQAVSTPLICQVVDVEDEKMLWVDGLSTENPLLVPLSSTVGPKKWLGSFESFVQKHPNEFQALATVAPEGTAPLLLVRAVDMMAHGPSMIASDALEYAYEQAYDLQEQDNANIVLFETARQQVQQAAG